MTSLNFAMVNLLLRFNARGDGRAPDEVEERQHQESVHNHSIVSSLRC